MNKVVLALLLGAVIFVSGCIAPPPPSVKITTCELRNNQISESQSTSLILVVRNEDEKIYQNSTLIIDKNPKIVITESGASIGNTISLSLQPKTTITKAFDVKGSLESGMPQATYQITIKEVIDGKNIDTCSLVLVVTK